MALDAIGRNVAVVHPCAGKLHRTEMTRLTQRRRRDVRPGHAARRRAVMTR